MGSSPTKNLDALATLAEEESSSSPENRDVKSQSPSAAPGPSTIDLRRFATSRFDFGNLLAWKQSSVGFGLISYILDTDNDDVSTKLEAYAIIGLTIPAPPTTIGTETDTKPSTPTPPLLICSEVEPEMLIAEDGEEFEDDIEEAEIKIAVEMTIVPVRLRPVYILCKRLDS
ncbi:hypothetical protein NHQ30_006565 [Ciborinia camelliae]|nr:hypothetical protein NHQ30_006565 [Ciborinia camelliae]